MVSGSCEFDVEFVDGREANYRLWFGDTLSMMKTDHAPFSEI